MFRRLPGTMSLSDFPRPFIGVVLLWDSPRGPLGHHPAAKHGTSRLPKEMFPYVFAASDRAEPDKRVTLAASPISPSTSTDRVGTPKERAVATQYPARTYPGQRFANHLTVVHP